MGAPSPVCSKASFHKENGRYSCFSPPCPKTYYLCKRTRCIFPGHIGRYSPSILNRNADTMLIGYTCVSRPGYTVNALSCNATPCSSPASTNTPFIRWLKEMMCTRKAGKLIFHDFVALSKFERRLIPGACPADLTAVQGQARRHQGEQADT